MKQYTGEALREIAFPLAGIGTGGISISGIGQLIDWELTGKPNKWSVNEYTHFAIKAEQNGRVIDARILHGDKTDGLSGNPWYVSHHSWGYGQGPNRTGMAGFAHFPQVSFSGEFPFAHLKYACDRMPADIGLEAWNPFIPMDEDNSSLPVACFRWKITNTAEVKTDYTLAFSVGNPFRTSDGGTDTYSERNGLKCITLSSDKYTPDRPEYGELQLSTDSENTSFQEYWYRSGWFDDLTTFWREFTAPGKFINRHYDTHDGNGKLDIGDMATLAAHISLNPGECGEVRFMLTWYFPNFVKYWDEKKPCWKHEYCRRFASASEVSDYCRLHADSLYEQSCRFSRAMNDAILPGSCTEAAVNNLAVFKSPTCLRLENGEFYAFEGTNGQSGSCEGTCDHVWGYQYALASLFPRLARDILETSFTYNLCDSGEMKFRTMLPLGSEKWNFRACVDGQMGIVTRTYREWKLSGDNAWLRKWWPSVRKVLEYAWRPENRDRWDPDKRGILTGRQHHTLDMELFGPGSWLMSYYLCALKAGAAMAEAMGEADRAEEYLELYENGRAYCDSELFNGRYYIQKVDVKDHRVLEPFLAQDPGVEQYWNSEKKEIKYQYATGSEIDQMVGQWHATQLGLGDLLDPEHCLTAAKSLYDINFKSMRDVTNLCRIFAVNDERGAIICEWPEGEYKPQIPLPYTEECMTGYEYAAAMLMIQRGLVHEGVDVVDAIRDRYDGKKRNPYAEIECGSSYARSMASFSLHAVFSGFRYDMTRKIIGFNPVLREETSRCFWSVDGAWGTVTLSPDSILLEVCGGLLTLKGFSLPDGFAPELVSADGITQQWNTEKGTLFFRKPVKITHVLEIQKNS